MGSAPQFDLSNRIALVTGASSGLGARFATILAGAGAKVVLAARRIDRLEALQAQILARGGHAISVSMDVSDEASTTAAYNTAEKAFGVVDTIIANAGMNSVGSVIDLDMAEFDKIIGVNLRGVFLTVREGAKRLIAAGSAERQHGRVVITASIAAKATERGLAVYSASKAGVVQMGKVMAKDWVRQGINVNMICPGYVKTDINADWFESEAGARHMAQFNRKRLMDESDLDVPLLFLASDSSRAVTGTALTVDDGQSL